MTPFISEIIYDLYSLKSVVGILLYKLKNSNNISFKGSCNHGVGDRSKSLKSTNERVWGA